MSMAAKRNLSPDAAGRSKNSAPRDPFRLLKAMLIGVGLGFIAVTLLPYVAPSSDRAAPSSPLDAMAPDPVPPPASAAANSAAVHEDAPAANGDPEPKPASAAAGEAESAIAAPSDHPGPGATAEGGKPGTKADQPAGAPKPAPAALERTAGPDADRPLAAASAPSTAVPSDARPPTGGKLEEKQASAPIPALSGETAFPKTFSADEMSRALAPLLSFKVTSADAAAIKEVISLASKGETDAARAALAKIGDETGRKLAKWELLQLSNAPFADLYAFRVANPMFPIGELDGRMEKGLFLSDASPREVLAIYANRTPQTGAGEAALGGALFETGDREKGAAMIRRAFAYHELSAEVEAHVLDRFGNLLGAEDREHRQLWLSLRSKHHVASDSKKASESAAAGGLRAIAKLRALRSKSRHSLHGGRHGKSRNGKSHHERHHRHRHRAVIDTGPAPETETGHGKAAAFDLRSLVKPVRYRGHRHHHAGHREKKAKTKDEGGSTEATAKGNGAVPPAKREEKTEEKDKSKAGKAKAAPPTRQEKAAASALHLSKEIGADPASLLTHLKALRRQKRDAQLWSLLRSLDPGEADLAFPERWWDFRRTEVRRALDKGKAWTAYGVALAHGPLESDTASESEFLAGWIALRFLSKPAQAAAHLKAAKAADGWARNVARSTYWLGRAELALHNKSAAESEFREASSLFYTYYGQLARASVRDGQECAFRAPAKPTPEDIATFDGADVFKAAVIASQLDLQSVLVSYFLDLAREIQEPGRMTLLLELAERIAPAHVAIRAAKIALFRGFPAEAYAFPSLLPKFNAAGGSGKLELALLHALTRQESDFHASSVSPVGARGLMQLMPETARLVASANKLKYEKPRLISDPSYNVTLGSAYLASLLSEYGGSYILALAAYNAGTGRVAEWLKEFGDPRAKSVDPIDWVERIPFTETREYVERILEAAQLYRCRFEDGKGRFQILDDLYRGHSGKPAALELARPVMGEPDHD